jgi:hypothetical protein
MQRIVTSLLFGVVALAGCQSRIAGRFESTHPAPHALASRHAEDVQLVNADHIDRPYVSIGKLDEHVTEDGTQPLAAMMWKMREQGGDQGCDAVMVPGKASERRQDASGTCVVFVDHASVASSSPSPSSK